LSKITGSIRRPSKIRTTFLALFLRAFAEADTGSAAVLIDELDAGAFESLPHYNQRCTSIVWLHWLLSNSYDMAAARVSAIPTGFSLVAK
jgi:hypothetical protein